MCCLLLASATVRGLRDTDDCIFPECNTAIEPTDVAKSSSVPNSAVPRIGDAAEDRTPTSAAAVSPLVRASNSSSAELREPLPRPGTPADNSTPDIVDHAPSRSSNRTESLAMARSSSVLAMEEHVAGRINTHQRSSRKGAAADAKHVEPSGTVNARQAATRSLNVTAGELCPQGGAGDGCELGCYCRLGYACFIKHLGTPAGGASVGTCSPSLQVMVASSVAIFLAGCIGLTLLRWAFEDYFEAPACDPVASRQPATHTIHTT